MYQWREFGLSGGGAAALPRSFVPALAGVAAARFRWSSILPPSRLSPRWWRGAATLALLCGTAGAARARARAAARRASAPPSSDDAAREYRDIGVAPLGAGARSGGRMVANDRVEPLLAAPERAQVDLDAAARRGRPHRRAADARRRACRPTRSRVARMVHGVGAARARRRAPRSRIRLGKREARRLAQRRPHRAPRRARPRPDHRARRRRA